MVAASETTTWSNSQSRRAIRETNSCPYTATTKVHPGCHVGAICNHDISAPASANHDLVQVSVICYDAINVVANSLINHNPHSAAVAVCVIGHNTRVPVGRVRKVSVWVPADGRNDI